MRASNLPEMAKLVVRGEVKRAYASAGAPEGACTAHRSCATDLNNWPHKSRLRHKYHDTLYNDPRWS